MLFLTNLSFKWFSLFSFNSFFFLLLFLANLSCLKWFCFVLFHLFICLFVSVSSLKVLFHEMDAIETNHVVCVSFL